MTTAQRIAFIRDFPTMLEQLVSHLTPIQLTTAWNAPEWTIAQNVHHCADSHMNSYLRCKFALTEENPTITDYEQDLWASLADGNLPDLSPSFAMLHGLHQRWAVLFENMGDGTQTFFHPTRQKTYTLDFVLTAYVEHGQGHLQQIREVMAKME